MSAFEGKPWPIQAIDCYECLRNDRLFLLPGHIDFSEYETPLCTAIHSSDSMSIRLNLPGAFFELTQLCAEKYNADYVFFDVAPNLGAINQIVFTSTDAFLVPTSPDPFCLMGSKTLSRVLPRWRQWADSAKPYFTDASYPLPDAGMRFLGEITLSFDRRKGHSAGTYESAATKAQDLASNEFVHELKKNKMAYDLPDYHLAEVPDLGSILPIAEDLGIPVSELPDETLPGQTTHAVAAAKRNEAREAYSHIADTILTTV